MSSVTNGILLYYWSFKHDFNIIYFPINLVSGRSSGTVSCLPIRINLLILEVSEKCHWILTFSWGLMMEQKECDSKSCHVDPDT